MDACARRAHTSNSRREWKHASGESLDLSHQFLCPVVKTKEGFQAQEFSKHLLFFCTLQCGQMQRNNPSAHYCVSLARASAKSPFAAFTQITWIIVYFSLTSQSPFLINSITATSGTDFQHCDFVIFSGAVYAKAPESLFLHCLGFFLFCFHRTFKK